jgi:hypothetical protein
MKRINVNEKNQLNINPTTNELNGFCFLIHPHFTEEKTEERKMKL